MFQDLILEEWVEVWVVIVVNLDLVEVVELSNLVWVQSLWVGVECLMVEFLKDGLLIVCFMDLQMSEIMFEVVFVWMLYLYWDMLCYVLQ